MESLVEHYELTPEEAEGVDELIVMLSDNVLKYTREAITIYLEAKALEEVHN